MFKKFVPEDVSGQSQAKSSVARGIRTKILEQYPSLEDYIEDIIPKKAPLHIAKWFASHHPFHPLFILKSRKGAID